MTGIFFLQCLFSQSGLNQTFSPETFSILGDWINIIFLIMMLPVIKTEYTKMKWFNTSLRTLEGAHRKRQEKREKRWQEREVSVLWKVLWIFTLTDYISFQYMYKCRKEVFLLILDSGDFSLYLYPGIIVTFYSEHIYLENMLNRPFLFHLNYVYLSSLVSVHLASCSAVWYLI